MKKDGLMGNGEWEMARLIGVFPSPIFHFPFRMRLSPSCQA
jgi:hypothetical protein